MNYSMSSDDDEEDDGNEGCQEETKTYGTTNTSTGQNLDNKEPHTARQEAGTGGKKILLFRLCSSWETVGP